MLCFYFDEFPSDIEAAPEIRKIIEAKKAEIQKKIRRRKKVRPHKLHQRWYLLGIPLFKEDEISKK
jgi:hypothetical protein